MVVQKQANYAIGKTKGIVPGGINRYLYIGKEKQEELGDQLDFGQGSMARRSDAGTWYIRWLTIQNRLDCRLTQLLPTTQLDMFTQLE